MGEASGRRTILITGAASGIGAETARLFSKRGWFCGLADIDPNRLDAMTLEIGEKNCVPLHLDVTDRESWTTAIETFDEATEGQMDVLFNNAGICRYGWVEDIPAAEADKLIDVNIKGVINGVYAALPLLKQTASARIVNTASAAGFVPSPRLAVYSATKFAVRGLTEALDIELAEFDIRVTSLMPWFVDTPLLGAGIVDGANATMSDDIRAQNLDIYSTTEAALKAWDAAHGKDIHYTVGKKAKQAQFAARFLPGRLRKQVKAATPERDAVQNTVSLIEPVAAE